MILKKRIGGFRTRLMISDNTWITRYRKLKNDPYSNLSTEWRLVSLNFKIEKHGIKLNFDQIGTPHADMCFSNIMITSSVF